MLQIKKRESGQRACPSCLSRHHKRPGHLLGVSPKAAVKGWLGLQWPQARLGSSTSRFTTVTVDGILSPEGVVREPQRLPGCWPEAALSSWPCGLLPGQRAVQQLASSGGRTEGGKECQQGASPSLPEPNIGSDKLIFAIFAH